jgi:hypothetical protein
MRLWGVIVLAIAVVVFTGLAWGETVRGVVESKSQITEHFEDFKFKCVNTATRHRDGSYGCFIYCMEPMKKDYIPFAYTFGEGSAVRAEDKALAAYMKWDKKCFGGGRSVYPYHAPNRK